MPFAASLAVSQDTAKFHQQQFRTARPRLQIVTDPTRHVIRDHSFPLPGINDSFASKSAGKRKRRASGRMSPKSPKPQVDSSTAVELNLEEQGISHVTEIRNMKIATTRLDMQIKKTKKTIEKCRNQRTKYGGQKAYKQALKKERAELNNMEASVLMWTTRKNECEQVNMDKRSKINELRRMKMILDKSFYATKVKLEEYDDSIKKVMKQADQANRTRHQAKQRLQIVWEDHAHQLEQIEKGIQHVDEIVNSSREQSLAIMKAIENQKFEDIDEESKKIAEMQEKEALKEDALAMSQQKKRHVKKFTPEEYEEAFSVLREHSGLDDLNMCISHFLHENEQQYILYRQIQTVNEEAEEVGDQKDAILKKFVEEQEEEEGRNAAFHTKLKAFQDKLHRIRSNNKIYTDKLSAMNGQFQQISEALPV